jgi:hypothetical protein
VAEDLPMLRYCRGSEFGAGRVVTDPVLSLLPLTPKRKGRPRRAIDVADGEAGG